MKKDRRIKVRHSVVSSSEVLLVSAIPIILNARRQLLFQWGLSAFGVDTEEGAVKAIGEGTTIRLVIIWVPPRKEREEPSSLPEIDGGGEQEQEEEIFDGLRIAQRIRRRNKRVALLLIGNENLRLEARRLKAIFLSNKHNSHQFKLAVTELMRRLRSE